MSSPAKPSNPKTSQQSAPPRARKQRRRTAKAREDILDAALAIFGNRGYNNGSLVEIADQVGMTHAGVLHHFGSKNQLLLAVLKHRDFATSRELGGAELPRGGALFAHLRQTARVNARQPGLVQAYAVLSAESVTDEHPAKEWFRQRYEGLRTSVQEALREEWGPGADLDPDTVESAAAAVLAVMDGLQIQWLLAPDEVDLAETSAFAINAIIAATVDRRRRATADVVARASDRSAKRSTAGRKA